MATSATAAELEQILIHLGNADSTIRGQAEAAFNKMKESPQALVMTLIHLLRAHNDLMIRISAAVLVRPLLVRQTESLWDKLTEENKAAIKQEMLVGLPSESNVSVRRKLCILTAELGALLVPSGGWNELLPFMFSCVTSDNDGLKESAFIIFGSLAAALKAQFAPYISKLKDVFAAGLNDTRSIKVRLAALGATAAFLGTLDETNRGSFQQLTPAMLDTINIALKEHEEEEARDGLELFIEIAEAEPLFFRPDIIPVTENMFAIASTTDLDDSTRHMAIEVLLTLCATRPPMMKKIPGFVRKMIMLSINLMLTIEDEDLATWNKDVGDDAEDTTDYSLGEEAMDRIAISLQGKTIVPILFEIVPQLMNNAESWKHRACALALLSIVGEGCYKLLVDHLDNIVNMLLVAFADPHPRVRWTACNCVGQMFLDFAPDLQRKYHTKLIPGLAHLMNDVENPKVQAHAAAALINFCEDCPQEIVLPYMPDLIGRLAVLIKTGSVLVQEQAITALASVADCGKEQFLVYYDGFMPYLKTIINNAITKEYRKLRGKAMECISLIGSAVGPEKFFNDAKETMDILVKIQDEFTKGNTEHEELMPFLHQASARICRVLGAAFVPYLSYLMPPLIATASAKADLTVMEEDESPEVTEGWEFYLVGDKKLGVNTSSMDEKAGACNMIFCYADEMKEGFFPYVNKCAEILVPLLKFYFNDGVKIACVSAMPALMQSAYLYIQNSGAAQGADAMFVRNLLAFMLQPFHDTLQQEEDLEILNTMLKAYLQCLDIAGEGAVNIEQAKGIVEVAKRLLEDYAERKTRLLQNARAPDMDDEEQERAEEEQTMNEDALGQTGDIIGKLLRYQHESILPAIQPLVPAFFEMCKSQVVAERQVGICVIDDIVEFAPTAASQVLPYVQDAYLQTIGDADPAVRQATVYGLGLFAKAGGEPLSRLVPQYVNELNRVCSLPDSREEDYIHPTENAISALGSFYNQYPGQVDLATLLPIWLNYLPVTEDDIESQVTYNYLLSFVEKYNNLILGAGLAGLPKLLQVLGRILETTLINEETTNKILILIRHMRSQLPQEVLAAAVASVPQEDQIKLQKAFQ